jgi:NADH-quinone oxidoreductase subunit L
MLIGHYMEKASAARAAKKAFIFNRVGDAGFVVGLMILWANTGSFTLTGIVNLSHGSWQTWASLCIFAGVIGKSAQFPLSGWLTDAMEGPTPVSALIHAATMVVAGVYLMLRIFPMLTPDALQVVSAVGAVTALLGGLGAISHHDIKKILAYSTISQLGFMLLAVGLRVPEGAYLHLITHAFFKGCLFLCAGAIIHSVHQAQQQSHQVFDVQDIRNLGGLRRRLPVTFVAMVIAGASLAGIPMFSGFLSKEAIVTAVWLRNDPLSWMYLFAIICTSVLTVMYTFRLMWHVFFGKARNVAELPVAEVPLVMRFPLIALATGSLWFVVSLNPLDFRGWIFPSSEFPTNIQVTLLSAAIVGAGLLLAWLMYRVELRAGNDFFKKSFFIDAGYRKAYHFTIIRASRMTVWADRHLLDRAVHLAAFTHVTFAHMIHWIDSRIVDGIVRLFTAIVYQAGGLVRSIQGGKVQLYVFWSIFTIIIFLIWRLN